MGGVPAEEPTVPRSELRQLARSLAEVLGELHSLAIADRTNSSLVDCLAEHLGSDPSGLSVLGHEFPPYQLVDVQVALEAWVEASAGRSLNVVGVAGEQRRFHTLSELLSGRAASVEVGPVDYVDVADSPDSTRSCVRFGMFLLGDGPQRAAALLRGADPNGPLRAAMIEIIAPEPETGRQLMAELRRLAVERSVLRGQVLALGPGEGHQYGQMRFMHRPRLDRAHLVLPDSTLAQVERHVIGIAEHAARLRQAGQHLKRGVLLYGPPGTGKTHTVRYLLSKLESMTAFVLSGQSLHLIGQACAMARVLQPSIVILEDVDLIAGDRSFAPISSNPLLFEVLNQIDGLGDDADVTFLLTTNRVDILERALSERPGRVDAAVEIAPPDEEGRRRLLRLYGGPLGVTALPDEELQKTISATEGRTATYIREVVRRAALLAADRRRRGRLRVDGALLTKAARELLGDRAALTRALLDGGVQPDAEPPLTGPAPSAFYPRPASQKAYSHYGPPPRGGGDPTPFAPEG